MGFFDWLFRPQYQYKADIHGKVRPSMTPESQARLLKDRVKAAKRSGDCLPGCVSDVGANGPYTNHSPGCPRS